MAGCGCGPSRSRPCRGSWQWGPLWPAWPTTPPPPWLPLLGMISTSKCELLLPSRYLLGCCPWGSSHHCNASCCCLNIKMLAAVATPSPSLLLLPPRRLPCCCCWGWSQHQSVSCCRRYVASPIAVPGLHLASAMQAAAVSTSLE